MMDILQKKALKHLKFVINKADLLLEVVDIRMPKDTRIYNIERYIKNKGKDLILVLNKADLVPEDFAYTVKESFEYEFPTVYISAKTRKGSRVLRTLIKEYSPKDKEKIYIGLFGLPNTGKSSIINVLVGRHRALTSPTPGFTKGIQLIRLSSKHYLIDSPGVYFSKNKYLLAILGAIPPEKLEFPEKAVLYLTKKLSKKFIEEYYNIEYNDINELLEKIAYKFNFIGKDRNKKAAIKILQDWISGKLKGYWF